MTTRSKVILLGKSTAGKSCLIHRYIKNTYLDSSAATIGLACCIKEEKVGGKSIGLEIWDTAGQERFEALSDLYYRNVVAAILCYDMTDGSSFDNTCYWVLELQRNQKDYKVFLCGTRKNLVDDNVYMTRVTCEDCKVFLCGTKKDLVDDNPELRKVPLKTIRRVTGELQAAAAFVTSSKTGENVDQLFKAVAEYCIQKQEDTEKDTNIVQLPPKIVQPVKKRCTC